MKKIFYAAMLLLGLSIFPGCSLLEDKEIVDGINILGTWCCIDYEVDGETDISMYFEFAKDGKFKVYGGGYDDVGVAYYADGIVYQTRGYNWEIEAAGQYEITDNTLFFEGFRQGEFQAISNDLFKLDDATCKRIRDWKTVEEKDFQDVILKPNQILYLPPCYLDIEADGEKPVSRRNYTNYGILTFKNNISCINGFHCNIDGVKLILPEGLKDIEKDAFSHSSIESIVIPGSVKTIGEGAFGYCKQLKDVTLGEGLEYIGKWGFRDSSIESIDIPGSVTTVEDDAFSCCVHLGKVTLGKGIQSIGREAFYNTSIESIVIPGSVKTIGEGAFGYCKQLKDVTLGEGLEYIGKWIFRDSIIESIVIPGSVKTIEAYAFFLCKQLKDVTLGEGIEYIGMNAFSSTNIESIVVPSSVKTIEEEAFNCNQLTSLYCKASVPPTIKIYNYWTYFVSDGAIIYVPRNAVAAYKSADGWSRFSDNIVGYDF